MPVHVGACCRAHARRERRENNVDDVETNRGTPPVPVGAAASTLGELITAADFARAARRTLAAEARAYLFGGAGDERTRRRNRTTLDQLLLRPRVLVDVARVDTASTLLGVQLTHPIALAPIGLQRLFHPMGELETARGAAGDGALFVVSTAASMRLEEVAAAAEGPLWFQLYAQRDRGLTRALAQRADAAGYRGIVLTVDMPRIGLRDRQRRAGLDLQAFDYPNLAPSRLAVDASLTWADAERLQASTPLPVVLKGILTPEDALRACEIGVKAIIVSNHGGRNVDGLPSPSDVLPAIADAVHGRLAILADGGVRRGTDVLKLLALGASAVLIGRPYACALHVAGAAGVRALLQILRNELETAMAVSGCTTIAQIDRSRLWTLDRRSETPADTDMSTAAGRGRSLL